MVARDATAMTRPKLNRSETNSSISADVGWEVRYRRSMPAIDGVAALSAAIVSGFVGPGPDHAAWGGAAYAITVVAMSFFWVTVLMVVGDHRRGHFRHFRDDCREVTAAVAGLLASVAVLTSTLSVEAPRAYVLPVLLAAALTLVGRAQVRRTLRALRRRGRCLHRILAIGHPAAVRALIDELGRQRCPVGQVVGCCLPTTSSSESARLPSTVQVYPGIDSVVAAAEYVDADVVAVLPCVELHGAVLRRLAWVLEGRPWHLMVIPALTDVGRSRLTIEPIGDLSVLHIRHTPTSGPNWIIKWCVEWLIAMVAVVAAAPLLVGIAVVIRLTSPGPALFRQMRVGLRGRLFPCLKFRTMYVGAEHRRHELGGHNINADGLLFKVRDDPRVTRVGAFLRRWSLDELPQLFNILAGQMSLVGPRPALPVEAIRYDEDVRRRLLVKPGLTGLWQVSGRSDLPWQDAIRLDLNYVDNWSLTLDATIVSRTISAVLRRAGAY
jgi:exopolysaccharide biosynthesis polyprenyl glycosylphosphotransferase